MNVNNTKTELVAINEFGMEKKIEDMGENECFTFVHPMSVEEDVLENQSELAAANDNVIPENPPELSMGNNIVIEDSPKLATNRCVVKENASELVDCENVVQESPPELETDEKVVPESSTELTNHIAPKSPLELVAAENATPMNSPTEEPQVQYHGQHAYQPHSYNQPNGFPGQQAGQYRMPVYNAGPAMGWVRPIRNVIPPPLPNANFWNHNIWQFYPNGQPINPVWNFYPVPPHMFPPPNNVMPQNVGPVHHPRAHGRGNVYRGSSQHASGGSPYPPAVDGSHTPPAQNVVAMAEKVRNQIEFYFSKANLENGDHYLVNMWNGNGWVHIDGIARFHMIREMNLSREFILYALQSSSVFEVRGYMIRKKGDWRSLFNRHFNADSL